MNLNISLSRLIGLSMFKYTLDDILAIKESYSDSDSDIMQHIDDDVKRYLFIIEYKFKDKKGHRSKYTNPKPISFCDIRLALNKLSNKTFDIQFKYIISTLHLLSNQEKSPIFQDILNHLSKNSFMLEPYSKLAVTLIDVFDEFKDLFYNTSTDFFSDFEKFIFPLTTTYNDLCSQNKVKDEIKAQSIFFVLTLITLDEFDQLETCLHFLQNFIQNNLLTTKENHTLEFVSNIYKNITMICIKETKTLMPIISNHVQCILNQKSNKNINRKVIFIHMDVNDFLDKYA